MYQQPLTLAYFARIQEQDTLCINGSQLAKRKEYSWHATAIKNLGMKQFV